MESKTKVILGVPKAPQLSKHIIDSEPQNFMWLNHTVKSLYDCEGKNGIHSSKLTLPPQASNIMIHLARNTEVKLLRTASFCFPLLCKSQ